MSKKNVELKYKLCGINRNSGKKVLETFEVYLKMGIFLLLFLCPPSKVTI